MTQSFRQLIRRTVDTITAPRRLRDSSTFSLIDTHTALSIAAQLAHAQEVQEWQATLKQATIELQHKYRLIQRKNAKLLQALRQLQECVNAAKETVSARVQIINNNHCVALDHAGGMVSPLSATRLLISETDESSRSRSSEEQHHIQQQQQQQMHHTTSGNHLSLPMSCVLSQSALKAMLHPAASEDLIESTQLAQQANDHEDAEQWSLFESAAYRATDSARESTKGRVNALLKRIDCIFQCEHSMTQDSDCLNEEVVADLLHQLLTDYLALIDDEHALYFDRRSTYLQLNTRLYKLKQYEAQLDARYIQQQQQREQRCTALDVSLPLIGSSSTVSDSGLESTSSYDDDSTVSNKSKCELVSMPRTRHRAFAVPNLALI